MPNAVLTRLIAERAEQVQFIDQLLAQVETEERDLVDAETANLAAARERITALDKQIEPLQSFEDLRGAHTDVQARTRTGGHPSSTRAEPRSLGGPGAGQPPGYPSVGHFIVDHLRAQGGMHTDNGRVLPPDPDAAQRVAASLEKRESQTTPDTPGLLPEPFIGEVINTIDSARAFISSIGARPLGNVPGKKFHRPKVEVHAQSGAQSAELTALASRKMTIGSVEFDKGTRGGSVDISRQDIDWTDPNAWNILVGDLQAVYALDTEAAAATAFASAATAGPAPESDDLDGWLRAFYLAAVQSRGSFDQATGIQTGGGRMPDTIWLSLDMWAHVGPMIDLFPVDSSRLGTSALGNLQGMLKDLPRVVVPDLPDQSVIIGPKSLAEFYEERIGLLSAVKPSVLGVEVAYGGYFAYGNAEDTAFVALQPPVVNLL